MTEDDGLEIRPISMAWTAAPAFREVLLLRRGPWARTSISLGIGFVAFGGVLTARSAWWTPVIVLGLALPALVWFARAETTVDDGVLTLARRPFLRRRRIPIGDIVEAEVVIADANVRTFGGWSGSRGGLEASMLGDSEQVGNRSIRLTLRDGTHVQFATWRPASALEAIRTP